MPIPTEPIGSIPRPADLIAAWADRQTGRIPIERFNQIADNALKDTIRRFEETGSPCHHGRRADQVQSRDLSA